jgi:DNA-binding IclR family transcriptional regulator
MHSTRLETAVRLITNINMPKKSLHTSAAELNPAPNGVAAVDKALSLLDCLQSTSPATLVQLATVTGLYKSTALRLLASLIHAQLVQQLANGRYALGVGLATLSNSYLNQFGQAQTVYPILQQLVIQTQECAAYSIVQGFGDNAMRMCLHRVASNQILRDHIREGEVLPLQRGVGGRVLIAFAPPHTYTIAKSELALYERIRNQGYYAAIGDRDANLAGIAAPVFSAQGTLRGSLTLTMPAQRFQEAHIPLVLSAAQQLCGLT